MTQRRQWLMVLMAAIVFITGACDDDTDDREPAVEPAVYCRAICEKLDACGYMDVIYYADTTVDECVMDFTDQIVWVQKNMPECAALNESLMKCVSNLSRCEGVADYWDGAPGTGEPYPCRALDAQYLECESTAQGF